MARVTYPLVHPLGVSTLLDRPGLAWGTLGAVAVLAAAAAGGISLWPCPWLALTGHPCPGCGMTRASLALIRQDWQLAWRLNPLVFPFSIYAGAVTLGLIGPRAWRLGYRRQMRWLERRFPWPVLMVPLILWFWLTR